MPGPILHPTTRIVLWLLLLLVIQCLDGWPLIAAFAGLPLLGRAALKRGGRLVWRTRWLILSLFVVFSWGVAGEPLLAGMMLPTYEGLQEASRHLGRLLLVLMAVAAFLEFIPLPVLLSGSHRLLSPLQRIGFDADRGVVRLMLVLRYVETLPRPRDWRILLDAPAVAEGALVEYVEVGSLPFRAVDYLLLSIATGACLIYCFRQVAG